MHEDEKAEKEKQKSDAEYVKAYESASGRPLRQMAIAFEMLGTNVGRLYRQFHRDIERVKGKAKKPNKEEEAIDGGSV